jgi:5-methylthioadenosine/S-adenosylhomocysteine deaminase
MRKRIITLFVLFLSAAILALPGYAQDTYVLTGTVVTPHHVIENGRVLVSKGKIAAVGTGVAAPAGAPVVETGGVIFPGLIDLHNHLTWNVLPRWSPSRLVGDRYEWQAMPAYWKALADPHAELVQEGLECQMERYAEIKALVGGATSTVGSMAPIEGKSCLQGLARNLDYRSELYPPGQGEKVRYDIFPFQTPVAEAQELREGLASWKIHSLLLHVAEGKDASAHREFSMLKARGFLRPGVVVIHGVSLTYPDFLEMAANRVGLVWSPRSNIELYGQTADVAAAQNAGVTIALAPDWSPSGSSGTIEELRYAAAWNARQNPPVFSDRDFVEMVTSRPARLAGLSDRIGSIAPGLAADLLVVRPQGATPDRALIDARPQDVRLVIVGGHAIYGDGALMSKLRPGRPLELQKICGHEKAFDVRDEGDGESLVSMEQLLAGKMKALGTSLAGFVEPQECR